MAQRRLAGKQLAKPNNGINASANPAERLLSILGFMETLAHQEMSVPEKAFWTKTLSEYPVEIVGKAAEHWVRNNKFLPAISEFEELIVSIRQEIGRQRAYQLTEHQEPTADQRAALREFLDFAKTIKGPNAKSLQKAIRDEVKPV
jgi:hypothetical protein